MRHLNTKRTRIIIRYFERHIDEIKEDRILRIYGSIVAFFQTVTAIHWFYRDRASLLTKNSEPICWPMLPHCASFRVLDYTGIQITIGVFLLLSIVTLVLFLIPRKVSLAYYSLIGLNIFKLFILALDFRLRLNQHIMVFWVTVIFLFIPRKKAAIKVIILLFYFWAGILKFNSEWLSGSALYIKPWFFEGQGLVAACHYVVFLETVLIWGLLFERSRFAWATYAQLCVFHLLSFPIVGFFYPVLMYAMTAIYPLTWLMEKSPQENTFLSLWKGYFSKSFYLAIALFSFFQILPKIMPGDTPVTGEGRLLALHMFDAWTECDAHAIIKEKNGATHPSDLRMPMAIRIHCDPIVYISRARNLCHQLQTSSVNFLNLDLSLRTRHSNTSALKPVLDLKDFCTHDVNYSIFSTNAWILKD